MSSRDFLAHDAHVHLGPAGPFMPNKDSSTTVEDVMRHLETHKFGKAIVFPGPHPGHRYPQMNDLVMEAASGSSGRLIPFIRVDPRDKEAALKEITRQAYAGAKGVKLHPVVECFRPDHPFFLEMWRLIADHDLFVSTHTDMQNWFGSPEYLRPVFEAVPEIKIIMCHLRVPGVAILKQYPNAFGDTAGMDPQVPEMLAKEGHAVTRKVLFATDLPYLDPVKQVESIEKAPWSPMLKQEIFLRNFEQIFK
jgi:predicted TIM-barrel fold metal-dependent hydrolase